MIKSYSRNHGLSHCMFSCFTSIFHNLTFYSFLDRPALPSACAIQLDVLSLFTSWLLHPRRYSKIHSSFILSFWKEGEIQGNTGRPLISSCIAQQSQSLDWQRIQQYFSVPIHKKTWPVILQTVGGGFNLARAACRFLLLSALLHSRTCIMQSSSMVWSLLCLVFSTQPVQRLQEFYGLDKLTNHCPVQLIRRHVSGTMYHTICVGNSPMAVVHVPHEAYTVLCGSCQRNDPMASLLCTA